MKLDKMKAWTELDRKKRALDEELKAVKSEMSGLSAAIIDSMIEEEVDKLSVDGYTLSMRTDRMVGIKPSVEVVDPSSMKHMVVDGVDYIREALIEHGFGAIVKPGTQALKGLLSSFEKEGEEVPEWLLNAVNVSTRVSLSARQTNKKAK